MEAVGGTVSVAVQETTPEVVVSGDRKRRFPRQFWIGITLVAVMWPLNWLLPGLRTVWLFFPLWVGYCLTVDGLVFWRKGTSLLTRNTKAYLGLFVISMPAWWLFEVINYRTQNWFYAGVETLHPLSFFVLSSIAFSTVIPAVFGAAEFVSTFDFIKRMKPWLVVRDDRRTTIGFFVAGLLMAASMLLWPLYCFPFVWISIYFLTEPVNVWLGNRSLGEHTRVGDWRPIVSLFIGVIMTAACWEMWNFFSYPKWIYVVPFVGNPKIFEMPVLGYGGYLPFSLELFAMYHLVMGFLGSKKNRYIEL